MASVHNGGFGSIENMHKILQDNCCIAFARKLTILFLQFYPKMKHLKNQLSSIKSEKKGSWCETNYLLNIFTFLSKSVNFVENNRTWKWKKNNVSSTILITCLRYSYAFDFNNSYYQILVYYCICKINSKFVQTCDILTIWLSGNR